MIYFAKAVQLTSFGCGILVKRVWSVVPFAICVHVEMERERERELTDYYFFLNLFVELLKRNELIGWGCENGTKLPDFIIYAK